MRQNVKLTYSQGEPIYIYSHWKGDEDVNTSPLADNVREAIGRKLRWDDESYLARMIFSRIVRDDIDDETGFGLSPYEIHPEFPTIEVNFPNKTVNGIPFEKWIAMQSA